MRRILINTKSLSQKLTLIVGLLILQLQVHANKERFGAEYKVHNSKKIDSIQRLNSTNSIQHLESIETPQDLSVESLEKYFEATGPTKILRDSAKSLLDDIAKSDSWISSIGENALASMPFGLTKKIGGSEYQVGFSSIGIGPKGTVARVFARIVLPNRDAQGNKKEIYFSGFVDMSRSGGIISDGKLSLIGDDAISSSNVWSLVLRGNDPQNPSKKEDQTLFKFNCDGYTEITLKGDVLLSKDVFTPVSNLWEPINDPTQRVTAPINITLASLNLMLIDKLKFSRPFVLKKVSNYAFLITDASLDFSDTKNLAGTAESFNTYLKKAQPEESNIWQGLVINNMDIYLPSEFKTTQEQDKKSRVKIIAPFGVIDATGFTTTVLQKPVFTLSQGRAGGWPFSVDEFGFIIKASEWDGGSLKGQMLLPIQSKQATKDALVYKGTITKEGKYELTVSFKNGIKAPLWKAQLELDKSSSVTLKVENGEFRPRVNLSGKLAFNTHGGKQEAVDDDVNQPTKKKKSFSADAVLFEELKLQTVKPYISIKAMGVEGKMHIAKFEAEYSVKATYGRKQDEKALTVTPTKNFTSNTLNSGTSNSGGDKQIELEFEVEMKLMNGKIGGKTGVTISALYNEAESQWEFDKVEMNKIGVYGDFGRTKFWGELAILRDDPDYGDGLAGDFFLLVNNKIGVGAKGIFGTKDDFRYWSVDAYAKGLNFRAGQFVLTGFSGGASYKMSMTDRESPKLPSGFAYIPDPNAFLRVRAGILFDIVQEKIFTGAAGFEIVFNGNWGVDAINIGGKARILAKSNDGGGDWRLKQSTRAMATRTAIPITKEDAAIWGGIFISIDLANDVYQGWLEFYVNFQERVIGAQGNYKAGWASFYVGGDYWNVTVGTPQAPFGIKLGLGSADVWGTSYFMMGSNVSPRGGNAGFGLKHGLALWYNADFSWGFVNAHFGGGVKYDIELYQLDNFWCNGQPAGLNGWYGRGGLWVWMDGWVKCFGINVFSAGIWANLEVRGPKPLYFAGNFHGNYKIGWCWFCKKGSFDVNLSAGTYCNL